MGNTGSWAAPEMCPGPLARCKQAVHEQWHDKSPWLCPWRALSSTVRIPWDGIVHTWQRITRGSSGTSSPRCQMYRWGCELLSWQHRAPGSPPKARCCFTLSLGLQEMGGKHPAKGSNPAMGNPCSGWGAAEGICSCTCLQAGGPGPPSPHLCCVSRPLHIPSASDRFPIQLPPQQDVQQPPRTGQGWGPSSSVPPGGPEAQAGLGTDTQGLGGPRSPAAGCGGLRSFCFPAPSPFPWPSLRGARLPGLPQTAGEPTSV